MIQKFDVFITPFQTMRTIHLYLPDDVETSNQHYPVIYMFDGHNLFYDEDATYGRSWRLKDYLNEHMKVIVVGIECNHEGNKRLDKFSPYTIRSRYFEEINGVGKELMDWVVHELKPMIDENFPTLPQREFTMIAGSSMGGLMSVYSITAYNEFFSRAACLSSSVVMCMQQLKKTIIEAPYFNPDTKIFLSWGSEESKGKKKLAYHSACQLEIAHQLMEKNAQVYPYLHVGGAHNEASWEEEIPVFMDYLYR